MHISSGGPELPVAPGMHMSSGGRELPQLSRFPRPLPFVARRTSQSNPVVQAIVYASQAGLDWSPARDIPLPTRWYKVVDAGLKLVSSWYAKSVRCLLQGAGCLLWNVPCFDWACAEPGCDLNCTGIIRSTAPYQV